TPLCRAAEIGDEKITELLLKHGAQPDVEVEYGWTPLTYAIEGRNVTIIVVKLTLPFLTAAE
ncbi:hypothetical protein TWF706_007806, partial [Orbilia oligospora]